MEQVVDILSWIMVLGGSFFLLVGAIGVLRFPDVYTRGHAAGITDTLGAILILFGLMLQSGFTLITAKLLLILLFLLFTSPAASHALGNAAWSSGLRPKLDNEAPVEQNAETDGRD
jgi:multicomponent Na+:H+ antiporter subunit G